MASSPALPEQPVKAFDAMHRLWRGTDAPDSYADAFDTWMSARAPEHEKLPGGLRFARKTPRLRRKQTWFQRTLDRLRDGHVFKRLRLGNLDEFPKAHLRRFLDEIDAKADGDLGPVVGEPLLIPLHECEAALEEAFRQRRLRVWGRRFDAKSRGWVALPELIPPQAYLNDPLLDWIAGSLGTYNRSQRCGRYLFPKPPIFTNLLFEASQIELLRRELAAKKRAAFIGRWPSEERGAAERSWPVEKEELTGHLAEVDAAFRSLFLAPPPDRLTKAAAKARLAMVIPFTQPEFSEVWNRRALAAWKRPGRPPNSPNRKGR